MDTAKKKKASTLDDDTYINLMYGLDIAQGLGDTEKMEAIKKAQPELYAAWERAHAKESPTKKPSTKKAAAATAAKTPAAKKTTGKSKK